VDVDDGGHDGTFFRQRNEGSVSAAVQDARQTVQLSLQCSGTKLGVAGLSATKEKEVMAENNQNSDLPEGTDTIIAGASNTGAIATDRATSDDGGDAAVLTIEAADTGASSGLGAGGAIRGGAATGGAAGAADVSALTDPGDTGKKTGGAGAPLSERLRSGGKALSGQAAGKARGLVSQGLERSSEALANVSRMVGDTADGIEQRLGAEYGDYARRAAGAIESAANSLAAKDPDELIDDTRTFVRNSPGVALAGAAVVGFVLARLVKTGLPASREDDRDA
jgi:ElaB/YqjD/DUF883 family membrane-anchored ribosome-binding protein